MRPLRDGDHPVDGDLGDVGIRHGREASEAAVGFRRLTDDDLPLLHRWLNDPEVVRWWEGDDVSWEGVVRDYAEGVDDRTEHWLALDGERPFGWIQCYALADYADDPEDGADAWVAECWRLGIDRAAAGIDYLIGEQVERGAGRGTAIIRAFVDEVVFGQHPSWTQACADPHVDNRASWGALAAAGFRHVGTTEGSHGPGRLMVIDRTVRP